MVPVGDPLKQKAGLLREGFSGEIIKGAYRRYFQHAHFIPIVDVGKRGEY